MNKQEIFDIVMNHLATQKHRSMDNFVHGEETMYTCAYRGSHGAMCAVGCLIKDEDYSPAMETNAVDSLVEKDLLPAYLLHHTGLLSALQLAHDSAFDLSHLRDMLRLSAKIYDLDASSVDNIKEWGD